MTVRVHYRPSFLVDVAQQRDLLVRANRPDQLVRLIECLESTEHLLAAYPEAGTVLERTARRTLRSWRLALRLPFAVHYRIGTERPVTDVWLLRLHHDRQDRPSAEGRDPSEPWRRRGSVT